MKKFILSFLNFIFAGAMLLILICPIATFNVESKEGEIFAKRGQNGVGLYFVESLFVDEEDVITASAELVMKEIELGLDLSGEKYFEQLYNSPEQNRYDIYNLARSESLLLSDSFTSDENLIVQTKAVSGLVIAYLVCAGLVVLISLFSLIFKSRKLKGFGTFLTILAFLLSVCMALVIEFALKLEGVLTNFAAHIKWPLYVVIGYTFVYILIRSLLNKKTNWLNHFIL